MCGRAHFATRSGLRHTLCLGVMEAFYAVTLMVFVAIVVIGTLTLLRRGGLLDRGRTR